MPPLTAAVHSATPCCSCTQAPVRVQCCAAPGAPRPSPCPAWGKAQTLSICSHLTIPSHSTLPSSPSSFFLSHPLTLHPSNHHGEGLFLCISCILHFFLLLRLLREQVKILTRYGPSSSPCPPTSSSLFPRPSFSLPLALVDHCSPFARDLNDSGSCLCTDEASSVPHRLALRPSLSLIDLGSLFDDRYQQFDNPRRHSNLSQICRHPYHKTARIIAYSSISSRPLTIRCAGHTPPSPITSEDSSTSDPANLMLAWYVPTGPCEQSVTFSNQPISNTCA